MLCGHGSICVCLITWVMSDSLWPHGSSVRVISQEEYCSGLPCPPPGDLPDPGIEPIPPVLQADSLPLSYLGSHIWIFKDVQKKLQHKNKMQTHVSLLPYVRKRESYTDTHNIINICMYINIYKYTQAYIKHNSRKIYKIMAALFAPGQGDPGSAIRGRLHFTVRLCICIFFSSIYISFPIV